MIKNHNLMKKIAKLEMRNILIIIIIIIIEILDIKTKMNSCMTKKQKFYNIIRVMISFKIICIILKKGNLIRKHSINNIAAQNYTTLQKKVIQII